MKIKSVFYLFAISLSIFAPSALAGWTGEVQELTTQVEAYRKKNYDFFKKAIANTNYERSTFMWFSKSLEQLTKKIAGVSKECAGASKLEDYTKCSDNLLSLYGEANNIQLSIYNTLESPEWKFLIKEKANLSELKRFLLELDSGLNDLKTKMIAYSQKANKYYAKAYASAWATETMAKARKAKECKELKKQVYDNSTEASQRIILSQIQQDPYLAHSSFYLSSEAQKLIPTMKMICGDDLQVDKISSYSQNIFEKATDLNQSKTLREYIIFQCQKLPNEKQLELSQKIIEICKKPEMLNSHFLRTLHFLTTNRIHD
jgi:hypothetical protein